MLQMPHCDAAVLHAPGKCTYCDMHPEWQELRKLWGISFTGEPEKGKMPCPAEWRREANLINRWPGNRPDAEPLVGDLYKKQNE